MSQIKILPEILSNKIAAGEVVERPASVVKELVENALDAGSSRIMVDIVRGGRSLIRVADNGVGMNHDDALLALERYATSKIFKDQDLFAINTLGFRGEALPSIAAVSRFSLVSRPASADTGTEIQVDGGKIKNVAEVGAPRGTMVSVSQLFFNTPARRKFLKTISTEMGHIADRIASIALGHPAVQFRLTHNDKIVKDWPVTTAPFDRVVDVLGRDLKAELHPVESEHNGVAIAGWISSPHRNRRTSRGIYLYVNGRYVRDRIVQHALLEGYAQRLVKGQFPVAVIFIRVPFDEVDVNVHPTKNEVRFARQNDVHDAVRKTVAQTLFEKDRPGWGPTDFAGEPPPEVRQQVSESQPPDFGHRRGRADVPDGSRNLDFGSKKANYRSESYTSSDETPYVLLDEAAASDAHPASRGLHPATHTPHPASRNSQPATGNAQLATQPGQTTIWPKKRFGDLRVIGQLHQTYIVCEASAGLILIDQHAAHERVLFEMFSARAADRKPAVQRLLVPETIELGYRETDALEKLIPDLNQFGLEIEPFGGNTFVVKAIPGLLADREVKPLIVDMVEKIVEIGSAAGLAQALDQCRMVMACHGAIRAHQALSETQIKGLLDQLDDCQNPSHCPHGRPTWLRWEMRTLEKSFKRIV